MFELYGDNELIGVYDSRQDASLAAFELMLDGILQTFEIITIPQLVDSQI